MADPVGKTNATIHSRISQQRFLIAGLNVTVYGLNELRGSATDVAVLWLLHARTQDASTMAPLATTVIGAWNASPGASRLGLIGVALDQRNHGTRFQRAIYNQAWREGNETHAIDMFSAFQGTMLDVRQLIAYLPGYVFPADQKTVATHLALGVSLGGHAVWHCLMHEPRITTGVVVIGGPDYASFMKDRARLSKRKSYTRGQGAHFFGSPDFPTALVDAVRRWDPAGILVGSPVERDDLTHPRDPASPDERARISGLIRHHLGGKRILCLSGAQDKLVPPYLAKPFMDWLRRAIGHSPTKSSDRPEWQAGAGRGWMVSDGGENTTEKPPERWKGPDWRAGAGAGWMTGTGASSSSSEQLAEGWAGDTDIVLEDIHFDGAGHELTPSMVAEATRFITRSLDAVVEGKRGKARL